jgi:hypothetical protein
MFLLWFLKNKIIVLNIIHMRCGSFYFVSSHQYFFTKFLHYGYEKFGYKKITSHFLLYFLENFPKNNFMNMSSNWTLKINK